MPALLVALLAAGCGTASEPSPPTGVDELVVPTPSVDPQDFVAGVDNPWLPLAAGATWTYRVSGTSTGTLTVTVRDRPETVAGVPATVVERRGPWGDTTDFYAQDREGNVWWLGREGVWRADDDGAEAGLAMPRHPRVGDGWRAAYVEGVVEDRVTVTGLDGSATTPAGSFDGLLELETDSAVDPESAQLRRYAKGVGPVEEISTDGPTYVADLVTAP